MLLNTSPSASTPATSGMTADAAVDVSRPAHAPPAPPTGHALLPVLEQLAQRELAALVGAQASLPSPPQPDPAFTGLAWDLGLTGDAVGLSGSPWARDAAQR
jgi:hypothetical protein